MSFAEQLRDEVGAIRERVVVDMTRREVVIDNLRFVYYIIVHTETLLGMALTEAEGTDYTHYLSAHLAEECDHAEWLAADLFTELTPVNGAMLDNAALLHDAAAIAGAQSYLIQHESPYALLGYMLVLECFPMSESALAALESLHGAELLRTLRYHSVHDVEHGAEVLHQIDIMPPVYRELVRENALRTVRALAVASLRFGVPAVAAHGSADQASSLD